MSEQVMLVPVEDPEETASAMIRQADPALLLAALATWRGQPDLIDGYAGAFRRSQHKRLAPRLLGAADGLYDVDDAIAEEIRSAALAEFTRGGAVAPASDIDDATFGAMMSFLVGEPVAEKFVPMVREQAGFEKDREHLRRTRRPGPDFEVIIIGSGMSGMNAAVKLGQAGFRYKIFEKEPQPGGTWVVNRYPGAAVDTASHFYSFSFELNPGWNLYYATGPEYLAYLHHVVDEYGIREHLQCDTRVIGCRWHADRAQWEVTTESAGRRETHWARAVLTAVGFLNGPNKPAFKGAESFRGTVMHSAEWDDSVELAGKNVVVVGAGCTAVQIVAAIAERVKELNVVQRHRQWVVPARTGTPVGEAEKWLLANIPYYHRWFRARAFWFSGGSGANHAIFLMDPQWSAGHLSTSPANDALMQVSLKHIDDIFGDRPDLREKVTPDYPLLAKRLIMDPGYYPALKRPNVTLHNGGVDHLEPGAVVLSDGTSVPCDVLVLATGFHAEWLSNIDIRGRDDVRLTDAWGDNPRAYLGVCVAGFPNFFMTCGPNTAPNAGGHNLTCEEQVHYLIESLQYLVENDLRSMEPTREAEVAYNKAQDEEVEKMVWGHPSVRSYQHNAAGRGLVSSPWPALDYWRWLRAPKPEDFTFEPSAG